MWTEGGTKKKDKRCPWDSGKTGERKKKEPIRLFSPLLSRAWSKGISVSKRMKSHLQSPEKTQLLLSVWKVTLHSKCSAPWWPWEVRTVNVKVDFTLCDSRSCAMHVASVHTYTVHTDRSECKYTRGFIGKHYCFMLEQVAILESLLMSANCQDHSEAFILKH